MEILDKSMTSLTSIGVGRVSIKPVCLSLGTHKAVADGGEGEEEGGEQRLSGVLVTTNGAVAGRFSVYVEVGEAGRAPVASVDAEGNTVGR